MRPQDFELTLLSLQSVQTLRGLPLFDLPHKWISLLAASQLQFQMLYHWSYSSVWGREISRENIRFSTFSLEILALWAGRCEVESLDDVLSWFPGEWWVFRIFGFLKILFFLSQEFSSLCEIFLTNRKYKYLRFLSKNQPYRLSAECINWYSGWFLQILQA